MFTSWLTIIGKAPNAEKRFRGCRDYSISRPDSADHGCGDHHAGSLEEEHFDLESTNDLGTGANLAIPANGSTSYAA